MNNHIDKLSEHHERWLREFSGNGGIMVSVGCSKVHQRMALNSLIDKGLIKTTDLGRAGTVLELTPKGIKAKKELEK